MAKIKDCVVIEKESLNIIINELSNEVPEYILNMLAESLKPLEPIVRDAFNNGVNTGNDYANNISPYYGNDTNYIDEIEL